MKYFFRNLLFGCLIAALAIFFLLYFIDPLGMNYTIQIQHVNALKPAACTVARKLKPFRLMNVQPTSILFGNSRAAYGVDPDMLTGAGNNFYNMAIEYCHPYEMAKLFEHSAKHAPLKKAFFFFDYSSFSKDFEMEAFDPKWWEYTIENITRAYALAYFSDNALKSIFDTLLYNIFPNYVLKGTKKNGHIVYMQRTYYSDYPTEKKRQLAQEAAKNIVDVSYGINIVKNIQNICDLNNIECFFIIPPFPKVQYEIQSKGSFGQSLNHWKTKLREIGNVYDFYKESYVVQDNEFIDHVHFKTSVGNKIIEQILRNSNATSSNNEVHQ